MLSGVKMTQRLIDADALKTALYYDVSKGTYGEFTDGSEVSLTDREILKLIDEQPTIDAEPVKHGKWKQLAGVQECFDIAGIKTWAIKYMCESCGFQTFAIEGHFAQYNYCPQCGADMRGEE